MNKKISTIVLCCTVAVVIVAVILIAVFFNKGGVAPEYQDNTIIIENTNAPVAGDPDITAISGFVEDKNTKLVDVPYDIPDTSLSLVAMGGYTGAFTEQDTAQQIEDLFAIVVKNTSDKVVSYSNIDVEYADGEVCSFSPTNIPPQQSAIVFELTGEVKYSDVKKFEVSKSMEVKSDELSLLKDKVGVSFEDGNFIVTNLTDENLGDVYIRYKNISDGNAYLGGVTYSEHVQNVEPYQTYTIPAEKFDEKTSVIIVVESIKD